MADRIVRVSGSLQAVVTENFIGRDQIDIAADRLANEFVERRCVMSARPVRFASRLGSNATSRTVKGCRDVFKLPGHGYEQKRHLEKCGKGPDERS
jgi:hypothetical protein